MADKFIVANLNDEKSTEIAGILSNRTAKKILEYLADNDASETQISAALKIPASTVNYNIEKLVKAHLVEVKDFHWSPKGNKVNVYKAARKLIIIAPKHARGFEMLKSILPAVFMGALFLAIILGILAQNHAPALSHEQQLLEQGKVKTFSSMQELQNFLKQNSESGYSNGYYGGIRTLAKGEVLEQAAAPSASGTTASADSGRGGTSATDYSQTNIQVEGVDEADIVKNDGKYIYAVSGNSVFIVDAYPAEDAHIIANITINGSVNSIYVNDDSLIIVGNEYGYYPYPVLFADGGAMLKAEAGGSSGTASSGGAAASTEAVSLPPEETAAADASASNSKMAFIAPTQFSAPKTFMFVYDLTDRENPVLKSNITMNGDYFNSRMIGNYVYLLVNQQIYNFDNVATPRISVNEHARDIAVTDIRYFDVPDSSYIFSTAAAVNLENDEVTSKTFMMGYSQSMYVSENTIYITYMKNLGNRYYYDGMTEIYSSLVPEAEQLKIQDVQDSNISYYEKFDKVSQIVQAYAESLEPEMRLAFQNEFIGKNDKLQEEIARETQKTVIHSISIDGDKIEYKAQGEVPGTVLNQFSMDEYDGKFRIATTTQFWLSNGEESHNNLYVLDENLNALGKLENLAEGERIYSVRFMGEKAYMVTFKQIDPLFVIDLADAQNPQVLGYLKIPGVSDYLHPYDETHVIGIGRDATEEGRLKGMKLSLFDVADVQNPKELSTFFIGGRGTYSEALNEHKAFLFSKEKNLLVIPATVYDEWNFKYDGAYVFSLNLEEGFTLKGTVSHQNESQLKQGWPDWLSTIRRSLYMENTLYTISQRAIKANDLGSENLTDIKTIELPAKEYYPVIY